MNPLLLQIENLTTEFQTVTHRTPAVEKLNLTLQENEILGVAGESGCGKSVTILSVLRLLPPNGTIHKESKILYQERNLLQLSEKEMNSLRGKDLSIVFQEPIGSFNPLFPVGKQIMEVIRTHEPEVPVKQAWERAIELFRQVRIPHPELRIQDYPFQFSGGMLQRALIALALACSPRILFADEPTTALDASTQIGILDLLLERKEATGMSIFFVSHDLSLLEGISDRICVLYAGRMVEACTAKELHTHPLHPYTQDLLEAVPRKGTFKKEKRLYSIQGKVPDPQNRPTGCKYHPRCSKAFDRCRKEEPELFGNESHLVRCWLYVDAH
ncbi:MAG: ABC transporter ATP-binding protein [Spirochaetes bacterium]|nr:ABC transporter ATP-binding protein [Spirochaetota bacterium]